MTSDILRRATHELHTLYLFTRSDFKSILFPISIFALFTVAYDTKLTTSRIFATVFWVWIHLLQFCVSNQTLSSDEDAQNKPWRPLPAQRITLRDALVLRWVLLPICALICVAYDLKFIALWFPFGVIMHNELKLDSHWFTRNVLNALAYCTFDIGATSVARGEYHGFASTKAFNTHILTFLIVLTTVQAQDFRDEEGDRTANRRTIPIVFPKTGRPTMLLAMIFWSVYIALRCELPALLSAAVLAGGTFVGIRFYVLTDAASDRKSYLFYNMWLAVVRIAPFIRV
ncbi:UbiA prenyltransferase family [Schizophyllum amplum]|uniref:UbiA prenyltransferase family n=1 Tax=Schizophyllum amplum TaxID=97359 RepID=A0A550C883_9AGAR|nr:UbiA prenyltransferase family [Auriculariopsis ampla]